MTFNKSKTNKNKLFWVFFYKIICKIKSRSQFTKAFKKNKVVKELLTNKLDLNKPQKIIKPKQILDEKKGK